MMRARWRTLGLAATVAFAVSMKVRGQAAPRPTGLCSARETVYFNCQTAQHKWIALCGQTDGVVQYRFGKPDKIELRFPSGNDPKATLRFAHYFRYQVDRFEVTFESAGVDYAVFDFTEDGQRDRGVSVSKPDQREVLVQCVGPVQSRLIDLESRLPCDADNALSNCPTP